MLHLAQGFQGAAEEGGLPSTGGGKKLTPVMPDSKESGHEDGSPGRKSEVIRRILQHKKVGTDILVEGQKLFNKLEAKFSDANISAASFRQLVDKCAGIEMILVNEMLKEVGIELDDRLHMNKLISGALAEARDNEERDRHHGRSRRRARGSRRQAREGIGDPILLPPGPLLQYLVRVLVRRRSGRR